MEIQNTINSARNSSGWIPYTTTITGSVSDPTPGAGATSNSYYLLQGNLLHVTYIFQQTVGGSNGTGFYLFNLPPGFSADTSIVSLFTAGLGSIVGYMYVHEVTVGYTHGWVALNTTTDFILKPTSAGPPIGAASLGLDGALLFYSFSATVPIN